jgi:hypothetical protein
LIELIEQKLENTLEAIKIMQKLTNFFVVEIVKLHCHLKRIYGSNYGYDNSWIIKPVAVSRGAGISIKTEYF